MLKLTIETHSVFQDLRALQNYDINAYGRAAALIKVLDENQGTKIGQDLIDQLNMQRRDINLGSRMIANSLRIESERVYRDLWRLKIWCIDSHNRQILEPYRIIYGFYSANQYRKTPEIRIFAVPLRSRDIEDSYDYQHNDPITIRIRADYDAYF